MHICLQKCVYIVDEFFLNLVFLKRQIAFMQKNAEWHFFALLYFCICPMNPFQLHSIHPALA